MRPGNGLLHDNGGLLDCHALNRLTELSMNRRVALSGFLALGLAAGAAAQMKPDAVIAYRRSAMTLIGWNFGPMGAMVKGKIPFEAKEFAKHAERIALLAPQVLEGFAKGSDKGAETDAKAEIWTHFDDFQSKLNDLINESKALSDVARAGDEGRMKDQFKKLGGACKACHDKYKQE
jgi:cytochrome c556